MYSTCILACSVILMARRIAADFGPEEYTTTSIQESCVPSQECPQELLNALEKEQAIYQEAALTRNKTLLLSQYTWSEEQGFIARGCDFEAVRCKEEFFEVFASGQESITLGTGYCELVNNDTAYWELYTVGGHSVQVLSVSAIFKKVDGKWLVSRAFVTPHDF